MFFYHKIVFGIKHRYQISDVLKIFKQQHNCSYLIYQHNAMDVDYCCDRPDLHYHGVVELSDGEGKIRNLLMQLSPYCIYINDDNCSNPAEYLAYITLAPKRMEAREILEASKLKDYLRTALSMQSKVLSSKKERRMFHIKQNELIVDLIYFFLESGNLYNKHFCILKSHPSLEEQPIVKEFEHSHKISIKTVVTAMSVTQKIVLNSAILDLSDRFNSSYFEDEYLSPEESAQFVLDWCTYQKLDPKSFVKDLIRCLDKKSGNRNSIYLQGSQNSGKSYIVDSIIDACIHVGQVMDESTAYSFVWDKCVDKRLILLREPHFSNQNFDQLDKILSGAGTLIYKHNDVVDYLPPTPVIILSNEQDWINDRQLSVKIKKRFLCCYMDLKIFPNMKEKKLHPRWLSILNNTFSCKKNTSVNQSDLETFGNQLRFSLETNNGMPLTSEGYLKSGGEKDSSHSLKTTAQGDFSSTEIVMNPKQGSEDMMQPYPKSKKRGMRDTELNGGRHKMRRIDVI